MVCDLKKEMKNDWKDIKMWQGSNGSPNPYECLNTYNLTVSSIFLTREIRQFSSATFTAFPGYFCDGRHEKN